MANGRANYLGRGGCGCRGGTATRGSDLERVGSGRLDGSGGLIKDHHDVYNPDVTYAIAAALAQS